MRTRAATRLAILAVSVGALQGCSEELEVTPLYNHSNQRIVIELNQELGSGEVVYTRARRGSFGTLDCTKLVNEIQPVESSAGTKIDGPVVDQTLTKNFYEGEEWFDPTPDMLAQIELGTDSIIDVCIMDGSKVVRQIEADLFQAWDAARAEGIGGKADEPTGEQRITSPLAYAQRCVGELGEIPFFEKRGDGDYTTYSCLDSTPIPMTVTAADGSVRAPMQGNESKCDNPQYIYSLCESGPRVASRTNEQGTRWVLLCRKSIGGTGGGGNYASDQYNDIAMIGTNPFTGKTCFFQNALYSKRDGGKVPHPADKVKSQNLWAGVHGGIGSGIECGKCHDTDAFIHTPWIDGAKDANGRPVVPKFGIDPDLPIGANDTPYAIVNRRGNAWTMPNQVVSPQAGACTRCHRMGGAKSRWATDWLARLNGKDTSWTNKLSAFGNKPENKYWMPPGHTIDTDSAWNSSQYKTALEHVITCGKTPTASGCQLAPIPETLGSSESGGKLRNPVTLGDDALAKRATEILGFNKNTPSDVCSSCHAPTTGTLREWEELTDTAVETCFKDWETTGGEVNETTAGIRLNNREFKVIGPYEVAAGSFFEASIAGTGDVDLYVKRGAEPTKTAYDCRPFNQTSSEKCDKTTFNAAGPAKFYVGLYGTADGTVKVSLKYTKPSTSQMPAIDRVNCFRLDEENTESPFVPAKLGIYSAGAHLGWFVDIFKQAHPNAGDAWAYAYGRFKGRVSMPKGSHPRLEQAQFDIVAEWFARGLPRLENYIAPDTGPQTCTPSIKPAMTAHITDMSTKGWTALNRQANMNMYGCSGSADPRSCLQSVPTAESKTYGRGWAKVGTLRVLRELAFNTFYWMRSSADGRFVANGGSGGDSWISDLQTNKDIPVEAAYDPGFFPDNKGWMFQGTPIQAAFCQMSLLVANPARIDFSEPQCSSVDTVQLYQHLGAGLNGADYFAVNSTFESDNPGGGESSEPAASFGSTAKITMTPMMFDGTHYVGKAPITFSAPYEGDSVLSPSSNLVISRFGNDNGHLGYIVRKVTKVPNGMSFSVTTEEVARYCSTGAKPAISYNEKYFTTHNTVDASDWQDLGYASANDPAFKELVEKGASNIILVNMATGARTRVTTMKPGQYALFPHFRSDGWVYFLVRDFNTNKEYVVGSDAMLTLP